MHTPLTDLDLFGVAWNPFAPELRASGLLTQLTYNHVINVSLSA